METRRGEVHLLHYLAPVGGAEEVRDKDTFQHILFIYTIYSFVKKSNPLSS